METERTYSLQTRIDEGLRAKIEAAAAANLRPVSAEAYLRLKRSFENEQARHQQEEKERK